MRVYFSTRPVMTLKQFNYGL